MGRKAALIEILYAIQGTIRAIGFGPLEALDAVAATVDLEAPADAIASLQGVALWADGLDNADAFVA